MKNRILSHGQGWCFTPKHFIDLDDDTSVRKFLSLLQKQGFIRRLAQGLYDLPREHEVLGKVPPNIDDIAKAIAEKNGAKIQPAGAYATNLIGISDQVPGRVIFLTDGQTLLFDYPTQTSKGGYIEPSVKTANHEKVGKILTVAETQKVLVTNGSE